MKNRFIKFILELFKDNREVLFPNSVKEKKEHIERKENVRSLIEPTKEQVNIFNNVQIGDLVYARMPLTEEKLNRIPKGHRSRPYYIYGKEKDYLKVYACTSNIDQKHKNKYSYILSNYSYSELTKDSYLYLTKPIRLHISDIIKYLCHVNTHDLNEINRRLDLMSKKTKSITNNLKELIPGDVIYHEHRKCIVVSKIGDFYRVVRARNDNNDKGNKSFYIHIKNKPYRISEKESKSFFIKKDPSLISKGIISQGEINKIYNYLNKYGGPRCIPKGFVFKIGDKYYYSYGAYDNKTQAYIVYKDSKHDDCRTMVHRGSTYYIDTRRQEIVSNFTNMNFLFYGAN